MPLLPPIDKPVGDLQQMPRNGFPRMRQESCDISVTNSAMQSCTSRLRYTVDTTEASMGPILMVYARNYLEKVTASNATHYHENIQQVRVLQSRNGNHIKTLAGVISVIPSGGANEQHITRLYLTSLP